MNACRAQRATAGHGSAQPRFIFPISPTGKGAKGFTLLELVIALTIVALIVVIVFGALRTGIRAWEKGERDLESRQRQRIVLDLVKRQLASTSKTTVWGMEQQVPFRGDGKFVEFISRVPLSQGDRFGTVYVRYSVKPVKGEEREQLMFAETAAPMHEKREVPGTLEGEDFSELISGMKSIVFEYLKIRPGEAASFWQKSWDPAVDTGIPRAVRVTFEEAGAKAPIQVIAAVGE